ncbi:hypothetical protein JMJ78_0006310, partial [Colletotrichum scovillei]
RQHHHIHESNLRVETYGRPLTVCDTPNPVSAVEYGVRIVYSLLQSVPADILRTRTVTAVTGMGRCSTHGSIGTRRGQTHCTMQPRGFSHLCLQRNASRSRSCGHDRNICQSRLHQAAQAHRNLPAVTPSYLVRFRLQHARSPKPTSRDLASFSHHSSQAANPPPKYHLLAVTGPPGWSPPSYLCRQLCVCTDPLRSANRCDAPPIRGRRRRSDATSRYPFHAARCKAWVVASLDLLRRMQDKHVGYGCGSDNLGASQTTDGRVHTLAAAVAIALSLMIDLRAAEARPRTSRTWMIPSPTSVCPPHGCHPPKPTRLPRRLVLAWVTAYYHSHGASTET